MFEGKAGGPIVETTLDEPVSETIMRDLREGAGGHGAVAPAGEGAHEASGGGTPPSLFTDAS